MGVKIPDPFSDFSDSKFQANQTWATSPLSVNQTDKQIRITSTEFWLPKTFGDYLKISTKEIKDITFNRKKLLLPIILGTLLVCLTAVAFYAQNLNPFAFITLFLTGVFLFYFGYKGAHVIEIVTNGESIKRFVYDPSPSLPAFLLFCKYLSLESQTNRGILLYHIPNPRQSKVKKLYFSTILKTIHASMNKDQIVQIIDPMLLTEKISPSISSNGTFTIYVNKINESSIINNVPLSSIL